MAAARQPAKALSALEKFQAQMDKSYGQGTFKVAQQPSKYDVIPTGSISLDYDLYVGGWVRGRLHEIWGPEGAGKTTLALMSAAEAQIVLPDLNVGVLDVEHRLDIPWVIAHGVDTKRLVHVKPSNAEEVSDMLKDMCRSGLFSLIILDSIGAMITDVEKEKDAKESAMGKNAQAVTRMVKTAASEADLTQTTVLFLNQVRANMGYGSDITTGGGFALKHSTTTKLFIRPTSGGQLTARVGGDDMVVGHQVTINIERNSVAPKRKGVQFSLLSVPTAKYGPVGIDTAAEACEVGKKTGIIEQSGSWYTIKVTGERVQGQDGVIELLRASPGVVKIIREQAIAIVSGSVGEQADDVVVPPNAGSVSDPPQGEGRRLADVILDSE